MKPLIAALLTTSALLAAAPAVQAQTAQKVSMATDAKAYRVDGAKAI